MGKDNVVFRTSVNGYNKKDVYTYIENVNKDIKARTDGYEKRICSLENETEELRSKLTAQSDENIVLKESIKEQEINISEKDALIEELDLAAVKISVELDTLSRQYSELVSKFERSFLPPEKIKELERKAEAYDRIVERAKEKQLERKNSKAAAKSLVHNNEKEDIDSILTGSAQEILEHIKEAQFKFSEAIENAQKESEILRDRVNAVMNSSKEKILSQIN